MGHIYFFIYRFILQPISLLFILTFGLFSKKIRLGLKTRSKREFRPPFPLTAKDSNPIWIHCSSGEFEYAKPILKEIKSRNPTQKTLVTFFSPSHIKQIKKNTNVDYCYPLPFDFPGATSSFINYFKPKKILFSRTDIWPELLHQARKRKIPTLLFSRTQKVSGFLTNFCTGWIYKKLTAIDFVSHKDKENFHFICPKHKIDLATSGDSRYDEVLSRQNESNKLKELTPSGFTVVLGSVWNEDLNALLTDKFLKFIKEKSINLIIAPHDYNTDFQNFIKAKDLKTHLYSKLHSWNGDIPLVIDQYGILFELYKLADLSFVGGSFKKNVHSVMEPLAWGSPVAVGPLNKNNREAQDFKLMLIGRNTPMVSEVKTDDDFIQLIRTIKDINQDIKSVIQAEVKLKCGASSKITDWALK